MRDAKRTRENRRGIRKQDQMTWGRPSTTHTVKGGAEEAHPYLSPCMLCCPVSFPSRKVPLARTRAGRKKLRRIRIWRPETDWLSSLSSLV